MRFVVELRKRYVASFLMVAVVMSSFILGTQYGRSQPSVMGHDASHVGPGTFAAGDYVFPSGSRVSVGTADPGDWLLKVEGGADDGIYGAGGNYGIWGYSSTGYAGYFQGKAKIEGDLEVTDDINLCYCIQCEQLEGTTGPERCAAFGQYTGYSTPIMPNNRVETGCRIRIYAC